MCSVIVRMITANRVPEPAMRPKHVRAFVLLSAAALAAACSDPPTTPGITAAQFDCSLNETFFASGGVGRDAIPALTNPARTTPENPAGLEYLEGRDRVVGVLLDGQPLAIPLNIFYHHEIVNLDGSTENIAVTYCPLTGSSLAFDRSAVGGAEFGVSGLLYQSNLIMYDRVTNESLWPQMFAAARCGPQDGQTIPRVFSLETTWDGWQALHPDTEVLTSNTGHQRDYTAAGNPYRVYEVTGEWWFPIPAADNSIPGKERVLGIPDGEGGLAMSFSALAAVGPVAAVSVTVGSEDVVVFWDGEKQGAGVFYPDADGTSLTFEVVDGAVQDIETGSTWSLDGIASFGPLTGTRLDAHPTAYTAFWRAWSAFSPAAEIWEDSGS